MEYRPHNAQSHREKIVATHFKGRMRLEIELSKCPRKNIAAELGTDQPQLSRWEHDNYPGTLPAHLLPSWTRYVGPGLLAYLAEEAGYELVAGDASDPQGITAQSLGGISASMAIKHGKVLGLLIQVLEDGIIEPHEEAQLVAALPDIIALKHYIGELHDRVTAAALHPAGKAVGE